MTWVKPSVFLSFSKSQASPNFSWLPSSNNSPKEDPLQIVIVMRLPFRVAVTSEDYLTNRTYHLQKIY